MLDTPARAALFASFDLSTARLRLRRFEARDIEMEVKHRLDPELMREVRDLQTREEATDLAQSFVADWTGEEGAWALYVVTLLDQELGTDQMIGTLVFRIASDDNETAEIGYRFDPAHFGQGYATEAAHRVVEFLFEAMAVRKVIAYCTKENSASFRLMERLGMQREAQMREFSKLRGEWRDELVYGLLRGELTKP